MDGASLLPRISGKRTGAPKYVFAHTLHESVFCYEHFSARSERYKLIRAVPMRRHPERMAGNVGERFSRLAGIAEIRDGVWRELYDLKRDPQETRNIIREKRPIASALEKELNRWIRSCGYTPRSPRS
jgi:hypothetical protein